MNVPSWYELVLLGLGSFRIWKLIGDDSILDRPRNWALRRAQKWGGNKGALYVQSLLECPWCAGFWVSLAVWGFWQAWAHATLVVCGVLAISAIVGLLGHLIADDD